MTKMRAKNLITVVSIIAATFLWFVGNTPFYNYGCMITPTMSYCFAQWYNIDHVSFYLVLGIGEALILAYGLLIWTFWTRPLAKNAIAVTMSAVWGIWIFLLAMVFSPPPIYQRIYYCPAGGCVYYSAVGWYGHIFPYLYLFFWYGEISALVVAVILVVLRPRK